MINLFWKLILSSVDAFSRIVSPIGRGPIWYRSELPWLKAIEANAEEIAKELFSYMGGGRAFSKMDCVIPDRNNRKLVNRWEKLHLYIYCETLEEVVRYFPKTVEVIESVPGFCSAMFSRLPAESKGIRRHRDDKNGTLRAHLGLKVPSRGRCEIQVGDQVARWREGEAFVMDASKLHQAVKEADEDRIVLIVDFIRPGPAWLLNLCYRIYRRMGGDFAKETLLASYDELLRLRSDESDDVELTTNKISQNI